MNLRFYKYHGTGNDFIIIDHRDADLLLKKPARRGYIASLCQRHTGIGADGLMLLEQSVEADFRMRYFNADGGEGSFCGNGSRCLAAYAWRQQAVSKKEMTFIASDGKHTAKLTTTRKDPSQVIVSLNDVSYPKKLKANEYQLETGSPHLIIFQENVSAIDVPLVGRMIRNSPPWAEVGINVNFVEIINPATLFVRTYERGVEEETLSCGTGVTAAAIAARVHQPNRQDNSFNIETPGGTLRVSFLPPINDHTPFSGIKLEGPAEFVFEGKIDC